MALGQVAARIIDGCTAQFSTRAFSRGLPFILFDNPIQPDVLTDTSGGCFARHGTRKEVGARLLVGETVAINNLGGEPKAATRTTGASTDEMTNDAQKSLKIIGKHTAVLQKTSHSAGI